MRVLQRTGLLAVLAAALLLAGCSSGAEQQTSAESSPSPEPRAPLTGETVDDPELADRPVLAVKIDNAAAARPQVGLQQADVVFEQIVEGGVTRFAAMFHSELPEQVGPVRSARLVDAQLLPSFSPILAYSGSRAEVDAALQSAAMGLVSNDAGDEGFSRVAGRPGSHDLFAEPPTLLEAGRGLSGVQPPSGTVWSFAEPVPGPASCGTATATPGGQPAASPTGAGMACSDRDELELQVSNSVSVSWSWDEDAGVYRRSQDGEATEVASAPTGAGSEVLGVDNVVALGMEIGTGGCCDTAGNPYTTTEVVGSGRGVVLRDGRMYPISWSKDAPGDHLELTAPDGEPFPLRPGRSWVHLMPAENVPETEAASPAAIGAASPADTEAASPTEQ